jgi:hypothetical protein
MSQRVDKFCDGLRDRLNAMAAQVESVKVDIQALPGKAERALQEKVGEVRARLHGQKQRVEKARADLKVWAEEKQTETQATVRAWNATRESKTLNGRAERAEAYAEAAVIHALASIDEAEEAILDAVAARKDADAAK